MASDSLSAMGRTLLYDKAATAALISQQNGLITRAQAFSCGLTKQALRVRLPRTVLGRCSSQACMRPLLARPRRSRRRSPLSYTRARDAGVAVEVDSRQWHLSPADWERTMARHSRMSALGITVLHYPPSRLHAEPRLVVAEIRSALEIGRGRPRLPIRIERAH